MKWNSCQNNEKAGQELICLFWCEGLRLEEKSIIMNNILEKIKDSIFYLIQISDFSKHYKTKEVISVNVSKEYDVLRLIEHKKHCYVSTDCVKGKSLVGWIKYNPVMKKEQMIQWIHDIIYQMILIHKCSGNPSYQYVNPYSIVVSEEEKVFFLDMNAASNQGKVNIMNRRNIRSQFLPEYETYYQNANEQLDIYGMGKMIQYVLAFVKAEPDFTRQEERVLKTIIERCIHQNPRKMFTRVEELQKYMRELRVK